MKLDKRLISLGLLLAGVSVNAQGVATRPDAGIAIDPTLNAVFGAPPLGVADNDIDAEAVTGSQAAIEGLPGLSVAIDFGGFKGLGDNTLERVYNYHHFTSGTNAGKSVEYVVTVPAGASTSAGGQTTGGALWVNGTHGVFVTSGGGGNPLTSYEITFGVQANTAAPTAAEFSTADQYAVRAAGFILSNLIDGSSLTADFYNVSGSLVGSVTGGGSIGAAHPNGDEVFFGYDAGDNMADWIHRIVITGRNGPAEGSKQNLGFDDFGFTPITAVPEPATLAIFLGLSALGATLWRRR